MKLIKAEALQMIRLVTKTLLFSFCLFNSTNSLANTSGGGGGFIMHNSMNLDSVDIFDGFGIFGDSAVAGLTKKFTEFDDLKMAAVAGAYDTEVVYKVQDYYADQMIGATDFEIAEAAMTASVLTAYGNYNTDEAVEAVIFEPNFSAQEFQNILENSFYD